MKYPRYAYKDPSVKTKKIKLMFGNAEIEIPEFDLPISARENFHRAMDKDDPRWVPNSLTDMQALASQDLVTKEVRGTVVNADYGNRPSTAESYTDWFNTNWTWVPSAGAPMLTPNTQLLDDITNWENVVVWPNLDEWDFEETAARYMKEKYDPNKALNINIGRGITERMIAVLGGYTDGMMAFAMEPEAVRAFNERFADHEIEFFDKILSLYPVDMISYHDDWGTERDTFFSEKMMEDLVFEPTKRIVDHIKSKGVSFLLHSCGNITRFVPYMIDLKVDLLQLQRRAVDIPALKQKYGNKIGLNHGFEGFDTEKELSDDRAVELIRNSVDLFAPTGGYLVSLFANQPERSWLVLSELFAYSREFYDKEQGLA